MGRVCFDHTPSRHAARVTVVVRDPELQTGTFDLRDVVAHIIPSLFGLQIAVSLHEQLDPADAGRGHLLHRQRCTIMGAVVAEAELGRRSGKAGIDRRPIPVAKHERMKITKKERESGGATQPKEGRGWATEARKILHAYI